ncbi:hypothetical protein J8TS2_37200 [Lederbergia ruris]|uniref:Uncharacterized protein n=1 Tax=Lederbergia ruris TaxID=217495 RepID=A0ABQ4KPH6_9BACI|nr:hypothetical protein J8TS2_37200 [Lederbergia ruris]
MLLQDIMPTHFGIGDSKYSGWLEFKKFTYGRGRPLGSMSTVSTVPAIQISKKCNT